MIGHPRLRGAEYQLGTSTRLRHGVVPEVWWGRFWLFSFWNLFHIHEVEKGEKLSVSGQAGESHFPYLVGFGTRLVSSLQYVLTGRMFLVYPKSLSSLFTFPLIPADCRCYWSKRKSDAQATDQLWLSGIHYECPFSFSSVSCDSPNCLSQDLGRKVKVTWEFFGISFEIKILTRQISNDCQVFPVSAPFWQVLLSKWFIKLIFPILSTSWKANQ